jgi:hypothetical protein
VTLDPLIDLNTSSSTPTSWPLGAVPQTGFASEFGLGAKIGSPMCASASTCAFVGAAPSWVGGPRLGIEQGPANQQQVSNGYGNRHTIVSD